MKLKKIGKWIADHKKITIPIAVIIISLICVGVFMLITGSEETVERTEIPEETEEAEPAKTTVPSPLTGVEVKPKLAERPVTAVMIENSPDARPQSGLDQAGLVFEAIAEGGITRFVALYQEGQPKRIGPVRSARPYYIDWVVTFDASYAHVGGSAQALAQIKKLGVKDLDQFFNPNTYERSADRFAPHNVYTDFKRLDDLNKQKGFKNSKFEIIPRKEPAPSPSPKATKISIPISSPLYDVKYEYDKGANNYKRYVGGLPHNDAESGKVIRPSVVVVMTTTNGLHSDGQHMVYDLEGTGAVKIFQDGLVYKGIWKKSGRSSMIKFENNKGDTIELNPGMVWITAQSPDKTTTWKAN